MDLVFFYSVPEFLHVMFLDFFFLRLAFSLTKSSISPPLFSSPDIITGAGSNLLTRLSSKLFV